MAQIISLTIVTFVTAKAEAKHELLLNKLASVWLVAKIYYFLIS
jgi:hypothetical protein